LLEIITLVSVLQALKLIILLKGILLAGKMRKACTKNAEERIASMSTVQCTQWGILDRDGKVLMTESLKAFK
jgi:hypothetical protein